MAAAALAEAVAGVFAEFEGVARGNPEVRAGAAVTVDGLGSPFDGKYTVTTSRHRLDPTTGYTTSFSVTGVRDRTLLGLAGGGGPGHHRAPRASWSPSSTTSTTRRRPAACGCASRGSTTRTSAAGPAPSRPAPARTAARWSCPRWATRCWSSSSRATSGVRTCSAASTTAWTSPSAQGIAGRRRRQGRGQPALDGVPPRTPDRPARRGRQDRGRHRRQRRRQGQPGAGRDRHQGDRALRRHGDDRGHPGRHRRRRQRQARAQGRPGLASRPPRASPSTAAAGPVKVTRLDSSTSRAARCASLSAALVKIN